MDPEVGEFGRLFQRFLERMSHAAQEEQTSPLRDLLDAHLGEDCSTLPVVSESFMPYDHVNVQVAVDAYLAEEGRRSELHGATGQQRHYGSFSDLIQQSRWNVVGLGSVDFENLPDRTGRHARVREVRDLPDRRSRHEARAADAR